MFRRNGINDNDLPRFSPSPLIFISNQIDIASNDSVKARIGTPSVG